MLSSIFVVDHGHENVNGDGGQDNPDWDHDVVETQLSISIKSEQANSPSGYFTPSKIKIRR